MVPVLFTTLATQTLPFPGGLPHRHFIAPTGLGDPHRPRLPILPSAMREMNISASQNGLLLGGTVRRQYDVRPCECREADEGGDVVPFAYQILDVAFEIGCRIVPQPVRTAHLVEAMGLGHCSEMVEPLR
jgi:hypothetical protein